MDLWFRKESKGSADTTLSNSTQPITDLAPSLITHARGTPQHVIWVSAALDLEKAWIMSTPKSLMRTRLIKIGLRRGQLPVQSPCANWNKLR